MRPRLSLLLSTFSLLALGACGGSTDSPSGPTKSSASSTSAGALATSHAAANPTFRPLSPASTSRVTQHTPTFRWALPPGVTSATLDLCLDRACTRPLGAPIAVSGASYTPTAELPVGVVYWRVHSGADASVVTATWELWVGAENAPVSTAWGTTFDVNGDGYADLAAGSFGVTTDVQTGTGTNATFVYQGGPDGLAKVPAATVTGPSGLSVFGTKVSVAGDVNGDGFADLVVQGWVDANTVGSEVYLGSADGLVTSPATTFPAIEIVPVGDIDGDGFADVMGASSVVSGHSATIYFGSASGVPSTSGATLAIPHVTYQNESTRLFDVAPAGDVNGDGYADVIATGQIGVLDPAADFVYLYLGGATGLGASPASTLPLDSALPAGDLNGDGFADLVSLELSRLVDAPATLAVYLGGTHGFAAAPALTITGPTDIPAGSGYSWGRAMASVGDVNGDGYDDLVVTDGNATAYVYEGGARGAAAASPVLLTIPGTQSGVIAGLGDSGSWHGIAGAGDVNGDGYADLAMSAAVADPVLVYVGSAGGLGAAPALTLAAPSSASELGSSLGGARE